MTAGTMRNPISCVFIDPYYEPSVWLNAKTVGCDCRRAPMDRDAHSAILGIAREPPEGADETGPEGLIEHTDEQTRQTRRDGYLKPRLGVSVSRM